MSLAGREPSCRILLDGDLETWDMEVAGRRVGRCRTPFHNHYFLRRILLRITLPVEFSEE